MYQLEGHVELIYPEGGESYHPGDSVDVSWVEVQRHTPLNWDLLFSEDGGASWDTIKANIPNETLNYRWAVPLTQTAKGRIKIVQDNVDANYEWSSNNFTILAPTGITDPPNSIQFKMYPNPLIDYTSIEFENPKRINYTLSIHNIQGKIVRSIHNITSGKVRVERKDLTAGLYFVRLRDENASLTVHKLLVK